MPEPEGSGGRNELTILGGYLPADPKGTYKDWIPASAGMTGLRRDKSTNHLEAIYQLTPKRTYLPASVRANGADGPSRVLVVSVRDKTNAFLTAVDPGVVGAVSNQWSMFPL